MNDEYKILELEKLHSDSSWYEIIEKTSNQSLNVNSNPEIIYYKVRVIIGFSFATT